MSGTPDSSETASALPADAGAVPQGPDALAAAAVRALFRQTPVALFGNVVGAVLVTAVFGPVAERSRLTGWLAAVGVLWLLRLVQWLRVGRAAHPDDATVLAQRAGLVALALLQAAMWGVAVWLFWGSGTTFHQITLVLLISTYCLGSVQILATQRRLFLAFVSVVFVPAILRVALDTGTPYNLSLAGVVTLLFGATVLMGRTYRGALGDAVALRVRTEHLAAQLRVEKAAADGARRVAEAANRAKTQFFAAASHDLRQPLHAMGLFAEALRQRSHDPEVASLVNSINESVDALEGLFGELLDITRIDAGGVDVHPAPVRLRELFARLRLHFEPIAFEKGLLLGFRGERHVALADPLLLERILRNLVSNAIRYTEDGGVLVTCRPRAGKLLLQVWDSGIGIAPESLQHIFDEFYQVHSQRPLEPHQRKGLGLGLAIVKRLAQLVDAPLTVRSRPGHGTVFGLVVPLGREPRSIERAPGIGRAATLTLEGRSIVVVEDEPAVREGLAVLLKGWGAQVSTFDSVSAVRDWANSAQFACPDLLIVDYRLPAGETGPQALAAVRQVCGARRVPAIMVTGSTLGGHENEAELHDYHLLIKPVLPNKLRAMIAFKLGER